jgi:hypothetical protein
MNFKQVLLTATAMVLFPILAPAIVLTLGLRKAGTYNRGV